MTKDIWINSPREVPGPEQTVPAPGADGNMPASESAPAHKPEQSPYSDFARPTDQRTVSLYDNHEDFVARAPYWQVHEARYDNTYGGRITVTEHGSGSTPRIAVERRTLVDPDSGAPLPLHGLHRALVARHRPAPARGHYDNVMLPFTRDTKSQ